MENNFPKIPGNKCPVFHYELQLETVVICASQNERDLRTFPQVNF